MEGDETNIVFLNPIEKLVEMPNEANTFVVKKENIDDIVKKLVKEGYMRRGIKGHSHFASLYREENSIWTPVSGTGYYLVNGRVRASNHHLNVRKFGEEDVYRRFDYTMSKKRVLIPVIGILDPVNDSVERGVYLGQRVPEGIESTEKVLNDVYIFPK